MNDGIISAVNKSHFEDIFEQCDAHSWEYTAQVYRRDIGRDIHTDFDLRSENAKVPIGSGSIGQVYKLQRLGKNGEFVALKVRHPHVEEDVNAFVNNLTFIVNAIECVKRLSFSVLIREFLCNINSQVNFLVEATNTRALRDKFANEPTVIIPEVFEATENLIIMSYQATSCKSTRRKVSFAVLMFMLSSFIFHDFMHCDLHYGNFKYIIQDDGICQLIIYDCGIIGSTGNKETNKRLILAALEGHYLNIIRLISRPPLRAQKRGPELEDYYYHVSITQENTKTNSFILGDFMKQALLRGITVDRDMLQVVQGLVICMNITAVSVNHYSRLLQARDKSQDVITVYLHGIAQQMGIHSELVNELEKWMIDDPGITDRFYDWLDECHGHRDKGVFIQSMLRLIS
jgi:predicted unusual protein kinase regulating ubiquinone biosynthesis (AarF/ABC1/UbiB family)